MFQTQPFLGNGLDRGVRIPFELQGVPARVLEEYVQARILQFALAFAQRLNPALEPALVQRAAAETVASLPRPEFARIGLEHRDLQLVFRHDCQSLGCLDPLCVLCEHNPHRRCNVNFAPKYLVHDVLKAKCDATIRVEVIDRATGVPVGDELPDMHLEMCILDGNAYDAKCLDAGQELDEDLESCALLLNNKGQPLLAPGGAASHNNASKVVMVLQRGTAQLPELHVTDSSEAMLSGRKPPFRLLVRAVQTDGRTLNIRHAVSEGFVVATRRTRTAGKVEIPNVDDHVSKLEHMGKETVKKLQDIQLAAQQAGVDISVPDNCINKVGEFRKLALLAEADGHLRQKLQQVLKLSKEKWDDARDHAMRAVVADNRMRIWYADKSNMEMGLLFTCRLGNVDLDRPVGLLQKKSQDGSQTTMEATLMAQQTPAQREQVRMLQPQAIGAWWGPGHPGWAIYPVDSEQFLNTGALEPVNPANENRGSIGQVVPDEYEAAAQGGMGGHQGQYHGYMNGPPPPGVGGPGMPGHGMQQRGPGQGSGMSGPGLPRHLPPQPSGSLPPSYSGAGPGPGGGYLPPPELMRAAGGMGHPSEYVGHRDAGLMPPPPMRQRRGSGAASPFAGLPGHPTSPTQSRMAGPSSNGPPQQMQQQQQQQPTSAPSNSSPSPFASATGSAPTLEQMPSFNLPPNVGMLNSIASGDLSKFISLAGFPSIPNAMASCELEALLQQHGESLMSPERGMGGAQGGGAGNVFANLGNPMRGVGMEMGSKLHSLELPDAMVAMLHDLPPEQRAVALGHLQRASSMQRANSGLQSMQSIEQALDNVEQNIYDNVAEEYMQIQQHRSNMQQQQQHSNHEQLQQQQHAAQYQQHQQHQLHSQQHNQHQQQR